MPSDPPTPGNPRQRERLGERWAWRSRCLALRTSLVDLVDPSGRASEEGGEGAAPDAMPASQQPPSPSSRGALAIASREATSWCVGTCSSPWRAILNLPLHVSRMLPALVCTARPRRHQVTSPGPDRRRRGAQRTGTTPPCSCVGGRSPHGGGGVSGCPGNCRYAPDRRALGWIPPS